MSINNTHYNLIDTLIFAMGKPALADLYREWIEAGRKSATFSEWFGYQQPVVCTLVDCFEWAEKNDWKPWLADWKPKT